MPTRKQMDAVQERIEDLTSDRFAQRGEFLRPVGRDEPSVGTPWAELDLDDKREAIYANVDWSGFTTRLQAEVTDRVAEGDPPEFWMSEIHASDQSRHDRARSFAIDTEERDAQAILAGEDISEASKLMKEIVGERQLSPVERAEWAIQKLKRPGEHDDFVSVAGDIIKIVSVGNWDDWAEPQRLHALQVMVRWRGVEPDDKRLIIEREVDFTQVAPSDQEAILGEVWHENDAKPFDGPVSAISAEVVRSNIFDDPAFKAGWDEKPMEREKQLGAVMAQEKFRAILEGKSDPPSLTAPSHEPEKGHER